MAAPEIDPDWIILRVSRPKVENVVKPPRNPVTRSNWLGLAKASREVKPKASPMSRQPLRFTAMVLRWNLEAGQSWLVP